MAEPIPTRYDHRATEDRIYQLWKESGYFNPDNLPVSKTRNRTPTTFTVTMAPPNITGSLHMGHTLENTMVDVLVRMKRMQRYRVLWLPGIDHASIATHNVIEKELKKEGLTRFDLGREKFLERAWAWKKQYGGIILEQLKKLGCSCDWSRTWFTMDEEYSRAVLEAFVKYYEDGLIYRGLRTINWCPRCHTGISDLEVKYMEEDAMLYYITYGPFTIATVRPETKFGDTGLAVHPNDARYKKYIGKEVEIESLDVSGSLDEPRKIKVKVRVVADKAVDPEFGTGVIKVTPGHDITDFEIGTRHDLPLKQVIDEHSRMNVNAGKYAGMKVKEAREKVATDLKAVGLLAKEEPYRHSVATCERCGTVVEPLPSWQWFVRMREEPHSRGPQNTAHRANKSLRDFAIDAVKNGEVKLIPKNFEKPYFEWLTNIRDWCVSRQLWWGQRIPVWYCGEAKKSNLNSQIFTNEMGFTDEDVRQIFEGKSKTYRLREYGFKHGDRVSFRNSRTGMVFGEGMITKVQQMTVGELPLDDAAHGTTYKNHEELIAAFKQYHPDRDVQSETPAWIYEYAFTPAPKGQCGEIVVSIERPEKCPRCCGTELAQDPDVLDTWFSSSFWPIATLRQGIVERTQSTSTGVDDVATFYPTDFITSAREILNLWITRMIFSGFYFTGKAPFRTALIHGTILTKGGKRMSKSLGTGVDPLNYIEEHGADVTRFAVLWQAMGTQDIRWDETSLQAGRKFVTKLWNIARFVRMYESTPIFADQTADRSGSTRMPEDEKILARVREVKKEIQAHIEQYEFGKALRALYNFIWHEFADKYVEATKKREDGAARETLRKVLLESLKILHPFLPFVTEELYQKFLPEETREGTKADNPEEFLMTTEW